MTMIPVFDIGMVVIEWNPRHLYRQIFADPETMEWFLAEVCHPAWNLELDRGMSFDDGVAEAVARHPAYAREIALYRDRWADMVPGALSGTVDLIEELAEKGVPLYAITNWNGDTFRATQARFPVFNRFRDIVVSGDEGLLKPDPEIYRLLLSRNGLAAADCLFIDDSLKNVQGAEAVGMAGHHFTSPEALRADLAARGIL
jgi:2-haloacid dehalogenase